VRARKSFKVRMLVFPTGGLVSVRSERKVSVADPGCVLRTYSQFLDRKEVLLELARCSFTQY
jgi:hypothetical protein